jgi:hypothetical protein
MSEQPFAKLFYSEKYGQILVKLGRDPDDDDAPEIRLFVRPKGLGVCEQSIGFPNTDDGYNQAQACFDKIDQKHAEEGAAKVCFLIDGPVD